jgi:ATP-dependent DNA ligase
MRSDSGRTPRCKDETIAIDVDILKRRDLTSMRFIEPMLLLRKESLPEGPNWLYEIKLDGYRALGTKSAAKVQLRSRNDNDFTRRYSDISSALRSLPDETVVDGEVVALDEEGRPSFNLLQNHETATAQLVYYVFDVLVLAGRDLMREPLDTCGWRISKLGRYWAVSVVSDFPLEEYERDHLTGHKVTTSYCGQRVL